MDSNHRKVDPKSEMTMETVPGNLENIAKFAREKSIEGSRVSSVSTAMDRRQLQPAGSLEALTPDNPPQHYQDYSLDVPVDDYETDSDLNSEECWDSEDDRDSKVVISKSDTRQRVVNANRECQDQERQLVSLNTDDGIEVDSEEERDIMKEIRAEIQNQVRQDLKEEIDVYQKKLEMLEREVEGNKGDDPEEENISSTEIDPKLKAAILKMRKLDRILSKKMKKEKEVKRERFLLQKRLREELEQIKPEGRDDSREVKANMEKFLMLALPPSHNEGVDVENIPPQSPVTPVFHTQLNEKEFEDRACGKNKAQGRREVTEGSTVQSSAGSSRSSLSGSSRVNENDDQKLQNKKKKRSKDFIKRNKQLAGDADNPIPMTDDEKKRISDLLGDLDEIPDIPEPDFDQTLNTAWVSENPFQISLQTGEGYLPEPEDKSVLERIDSQLRMLLPEEEFTAMCSSQYTFDRQRLLSTRATVLSGSELEFDRLGEKALQEKRDERDLQTRLRRIEEELSRLKHPNEDIELDTPSLTDDTLHDLIDQCVRSLSRTTLSTVREGQDTPQSDLLENPPRLEEHVLQRLLSEARESLPSSRVATDRDGINDVRNHHFTKELGIEPISRETWDVILSHEMCDSDGDMPVPGGDLDDISERSEGSTVRQSRVQNDVYHTREPATGSLEENLHQRRSDTPLSIQSFRESDVYDYNSSRASSIRLSRTPFLPEISQSPCLVSQGASANGVRSYDSSAQSDWGVASVDNSLPRPPMSDKPQNSNNSRSRSFMSPPSKS
ncbi:fibrous sheath-interacting protein 1-like [Liolophura sinensis]|uniref:fibrous sheath-interacting protein 1-like n=1 Tax=Liolophura sinensis TaxID=3198878 RepID=UPI00315872AE